MEKIRGDLHTLSQREEPHPLSPPLETHVDLARVNNDIPSEAEVEAVVRRLRPYRAGIHTHLRVEHFKQWRREAYPG